MQDFSAVAETEAWAELVARLGGASELATSARTYGALVRRRGVKSAEALLRLLFAYGPGGRSLRAAAAEAAALEVTAISDVALLKRLRLCGDWLTALIEGQLAKVAGGVAQEGEQPVRLIDASRIEGPGDSCWRLHLCWDARRRRIAQLKVTSLDEGERLDTLEVLPGEIRIADRGYPRLDGLRAVRQAGGEVLVRLTWNSLRLTDAEDAPLDWTALFDRAARDGVVDRPVKVCKPRGGGEPLPLRLVVIRKPPEALDQARKRATRAAQKDQHELDPRTLAGADHLVLITSLDAAAFPPQRLGELYRVRWQIELAFKRLKSILRLDQLRAKDPALVRAWIGAHLLFALLIEDTAADLADSPP